MAQQQPLTPPTAVPLQDDPSWHNADDDQNEDAGAGDRYEFGQECLDRVSISLGGACR